ncbi:Cellulose synthase catalytic subunit [UDP-forming] [Chromobacterium violaceum]|uniref:Cellulose synthase catalytic subunit [UDP-forming] n=1 Tax=Chromobacterium violaceum TaxID=536 RepID=A0A447TEU5_CHRVL|nr:Cellulose synthase catalytic subunit [UDP-forming] [Chromobacterium violaceum]
MALVAVCVTTPFDDASQALFFAALLLIALWVNRVPGQVCTLMLMVFSMVMSTRYIWWRATSTINDDTWLNLAFGLMLLAAEIFAWIVLSLGFSSRPGRSSAGSRRCPMTAPCGLRWMCSFRSTTSPCGC